LTENVWLPDGRYLLIGGDESSQSEHCPSGGHFLTEFRLENQMPVWRYEAEGVVLEKFLVLLYGQNTVQINYRVLTGPPTMRLELRPAVHFRRHEHSVSESIVGDYLFSAENSRYEISAGP